MNTIINFCQSIKKQRGFKPISFSTVCEEIRNGKYADAVQYVRDTPRDENFDKEEKRRKRKLPSFQCSIGDDWSKHTGIICLDFDNVTDVEATKKSAMEIQFTLMCCTSPSNRGVKVFVRCTNAHKNSHKTMYAEIAKMYAWELKDLAPEGWDTQCVNQNRLCFYTYDPNLLTNPDCHAYKYKTQKKVKEEQKEKMAELRGYFDSTFFGDAATTETTQEQPQQEPQQETTQGEETPIESLVDDTGDESIRTMTRDTLERICELTDFDQRRTKLHLLARGIKFNLIRSELGNIQAIFDAWYSWNKDFFHSKEYAVSFSDFRNALKDAQKPLQTQGDTPYTNTLAKACEQAQGAIDGVCDDRIKEALSIRQKSQERLVILAKMMWVLSHNGKHSFFASHNDLGWYIDADRRVVIRMIQTLIDKGFLQVVKKGSCWTRKANDYRFLIDLKAV